MAKFYQAPSKKAAEFIPPPPEWYICGVCGNDRASFGHTIKNITKKYCLECWRAYEKKQG